MTHTMPKTLPEPEIVNIRPDQQPGLFTVRYAKIGYLGDSLDIG
jgi:hypothetical protein